MDSISINKFLNAKQKRQLIKKFEGMCSDAEIRQLISRITLNEKCSPSLDLLENLDLIHRLIADRRKINFEYGKYDTDKKIKYYNKKRDLLPVRVVYFNERIYLKCYNEADERWRIYRVDRISIVLGVLLGAVVGFAVYLLFEGAYKREHKIRNSTKVIILLGLAFLLMSIETLVKPYVALSGLLAVVAMACVVKLKIDKSVSVSLSGKFGKLWIAAEVMLFVLVGAAVDVCYTLSAGSMAVLMIFIALTFRAIGVCLCLLGTELNAKERIFCVIAYLPKATVQAAIGSVPLSLGLPCGKIVLSVAVLAILITAPLGAIGIDKTYQKLLCYET